MDSKPSKADVEARLEQATDKMSDRLDSIQEEVSSTGGSIRDWLAENPLKSVGAMLAAGVAVGLIFGGSRSGRSSGSVADGDASLDDILRSAAADDWDSTHRPVVIYRDDTSGDNSSSLLSRLVRNSGEIVFRTAIGLIARDVIESLLADADVDELLDDADLFD